jgi:hypothetical protein
MTDTVPVVDDHDRLLARVEELLRLLREATRLLAERGLAQNTQVMRRLTLALKEVPR